ncbi:hypothetical protein [Rhodococcus sp. T7]|nr:hypothetical protein [Rhodococcus sp. T7]
MSYPRFAAWRPTRSRSADALVDYLDADGLRTLSQALTDRH